MGTLLGLDAKLYRLSTGTRAAWPGTGSPSNLDEIPNVRDLTLNLSRAEADVTTRGSNGWRVTVGALKDASLEFEMVWDPADTDFVAIRDAFMNGTTIALAALDQAKATTGAQGLWADWRVTGFSKTEPLEDAQKVSVTIKPSYSAVPPEWVTVAA